MTESIVTLVANMRESVGKGTARAVRREDKVPAVIYGDKKAPLSISLESKVIERFVNKPSFFTHLFDIELDGKKHRVIPRDVQFDPITDRALHVDFLRVSASTKVKVEIPVLFVDQDKCPGIKRGGTLNIVHHELEVLCAPGKIPNGFTVSLEGYGIGEAVHLSAIKLPEGVTLTTHEKEFTIASIAVPSAIRSEVDAAAAPAAATAAAPAAGAKAAAPAAGAKAAAPAAAAKPAAKK